MDISIICPIYNGENYIKKLNESLLMQEGAGDFEIRYILTRSKDSSEEILKSLNAQYTLVEPEEFSHSLSREQEAFRAEGDIIVFISQDVIIQDKYWLANLTKDIKRGICDASFSRQLSDNKTIERYTRMKNYPEESRIVSKADIDRLGVMTFFYSDASSAIRKTVYEELKGYDGKRLLTNEDMYIAYKIINNGYKIKYCADSKVIHSHEYSYKSLLKRYFDQGVFLAQHSYIANAGKGSTSSAKALLVFVIKNALKEKNFRVLFDIIPNFAVRFIGDKLGRRYKKLSKDRILKYTSNKSYWLKEVYK